MAKLYFRYGSMNCGKSTAIIQVAYNYEEKDKKVIILKPKVDTKGGDCIINRNNLKRKVDYLIDSHDLITPLLTKGIDAILVDEAELLTKDQIDELYCITKKKDIPVLCYGLRCDFQMNPFPGSARLLAIADTIEELKNICACGKKATQNIRLVNGKPTFSGNQIAIDGENATTYESVCGSCYLKLKEEGEKNERKDN